MRCAGAVGADQDLPVKRLRVDLRKREIQHGLVIGGGVRAGVPRPQDPCGRRAGPVAIAQQRMMAVAALEVPGRVLLLRAGARERRVDVDHRPLRTTVPSRDRPLRPRPELPRPRSGERDRRAQPAQALLVDRIDHPERRRVRRDVAIQVRLVTLSSQVSQTTPAVGEHHRQVAQHSPRVMRRRALPGRGHRRRQRSCQPDPISDAGDQRAAGMPDHARPVRPNI